MKTVIKKTILTVLVLTFWGCNENRVSNDARNELVKDYGFRIEEELKEYISESFDENRNYAMGNGIKVLNLDKDSDELQMFPVYCDDELIFLILYGQGTDYLSDPILLNAIEEDNEFLILKADGNVYYVSKEKTLIVDGEGKELSEKMKNRINKVKEANIEKNLMGIEKRAIRIVSEKEQQPIINELRYYNDRIAIRFASEKIENKIRMYEAFCHGRVEESASDDNTYVFYFELLNSENLGILLDASKGLSYVLDASLIEKTEESKPIAEIDFSQPVTEKEPLELP
ncbi:MAG: hypothetical protein IJF87_07760 [Erysipelotrichaceae bacterium]|nr:hypothetical protein [Erysipelotrichaceae bacterium]